MCNHITKENELLSRDLADYPQLSTEIERVATQLEQEKEVSNDEDAIKKSRSFESLVYRLNGKVLQARWCVIENEYLSFFASKFSHLVGQDALLELRLEDILTVRSFKDHTLFFFEVLSRNVREVFAVKEQELWEKWSHEFQENVTVFHPEEL